MKNFILILIGLLIGLLIGYLLFKCKDDVHATEVASMSPGELFTKYQSEIEARDNKFAGISIDKNFNDSLQTLTAGWSKVEYVFGLDSLKNKIFLISGFKNGSGKPEQVDSVIFLTNLESKYPKMDIVKMDKSYIQMAQKSGNSTSKFIMETFFNSANANAILTCPKWCPGVVPANLTGAGS